MALESSEARVGQLARQMLAYGRPIPLEESSPRSTPSPSRAPALPAAR